MIILFDHCHTCQQAWGDATTGGCTAVLLARANLLLTEERDRLERTASTNYQAVLALTDELSDATARVAELEGLLREAFGNLDDLTPVDLLRRMDAALAVSTSGVGEGARAAFTHDLDVVLGLVGSEDAALEALDDTRRKLVAMLAGSPAPNHPLELLVLDVTNTLNDLARLRAERARQTPPHDHASREG
jgi:hypothetical protein